MASCRHLQQRAQSNQACILHTPLKRGTECACTLQQLPMSDHLVTRKPAMSLSGCHDHDRQELHSNTLRTEKNEKPRIKRIRKVTSEVRSAWMAASFRDVNFRSSQFQSDGIGCREGVLTRLSTSLIRSVRPGSKCGRLLRSPCVPGLRLISFR